MKQLRLHIPLMHLCLSDNINVQMVKNPTARFSVQLFHYNHVVGPFLSGLFHQFRRSLSHKLPTFVERELTIMLLPARLVVFAFIYLLISHNYPLLTPFPISWRGGISLFFSSFSQKIDFQCVLSLTSGGGGMLPFF